MEGIQSETDAECGEGDSDHVIIRREFSQKRTLSVVSGERYGGQGSVESVKSFLLPKMSSKETLSQGGRT